MTSERSTVVMNPDPLTWAYSALTIVLQPRGIELIPNGCMHWFDFIITYHQKYLRFKYVCHLNPGVIVMLEKVEKLSCDSVHLLTEVHNYIYVFFCLHTDSLENGPLLQSWKCYSGEQCNLSGKDEKLQLQRNRWVKKCSLKSCYIDYTV